MMEIGLKGTFKCLIANLDPQNICIFFFFLSTAISARNISVASLFLHLYLWMTLWRKRAVVCFFINEIHKVSALLPILL